jgi:SAM-dependent methyltransferase
MPGSEASARQAEYYEATSEAYDSMHVAENDEHMVALGHVSDLIAGRGFRSVLDVGAGTGRAIAYLSRRHPDLELRGVEPVQALIDVAVDRHGVEPGVIVPGDGVRLPFEDDAFDVVCEFAVLHHVERPDAVVAEILRVARHAVCLSDDNRFANGSAAMRLAKLALHRSGIWEPALRIRNRGRRWRYTDDDGVFYSYSVYDSFAALAAWGDRAFFIPTDPHGPSGWFHPLLTSGHVLLCALREADVA